MLWTHETYVPIYAPYQPKRLPRSSGMVGGMEHLAIAMSCNFANIAVLCPIACSSTWGTVTNQCDSKPNPNAREQREYQGPCIEAWLEEIAPNAYPAWSPKMADFLQFLAS